MYTAIGAKMTEGNPRKHGLVPATSSAGSLDSESYKEEQILETICLAFYKSDFIHRVECR